MVLFSANPLSLNVPEPAFESWLRESGYLEILDRHHHNPTPSSTTSNNATVITTSNSLFLFIFSYLNTIFSLITLNPFAKLTTNDFSGETPSWTVGFIGFFDSYSFPGTPSQARLRVHENVKRYVRNYSTLCVVFFVCALYQMPIAILGLVLSLGMWDLFRLGSDRWGLDRYPVLQISLVRLAQCATAVLLYWSNVQVAVFCAIAVSYAVTILHASLRKLSPIKQPTRADGYRRFSTK
ncbi:hypothetical protein GIB67_037924 [Kingdonia uniflora]|uniref:PRA1 family protein n=1 Tax=Kingdonia uniflora TaxID=39325 RepID=A0A7J7LH21_9MAGN|nr:hypothetical protein GIB67_037924 [Kingdonia uniflora]